MGTKRAARRRKDIDIHPRSTSVADQPAGGVPAAQVAAHVDILRLQRAVGNQAVQRLLANGRGVTSGAVQREDDSGGLRWKPSSDYQLRLDPEIEAQIRAINLMNSQVRFQAVEQGLKSIDLFKIPIPANTPAPMNMDPSPEAKPLVPPGPGPATPQPGGVGDIFGAIMAVPAVEQAVGQLNDDAQTRIKRDWSSLTGGGKFSMIAATAVIGGGALTAALAKEDSRKFILENVQGKSIPVPGVPGLTVQVNIIGEEKKVFFGLDLMQFLPAALK